MERFDITKSTKYTITLNKNSKAHLDNCIHEVIKEYKLRPSANGAIRRLENYVEDLVSSTFKEGLREGRNIK